VALGVGLPVLLALSAVVVIEYNRDRQLIEEQFQLTSTQLGKLTLAGLQQAMLENDKARIFQIVTDVASTENVQRIQIVDSSGRVRTDSLEKDIGAIHQTESLGCTECHATPIEDRPQAIRLDTTAGSMRISTPITNSTDCHACHDAALRFICLCIL
jgi:hypothetical protein